MHIDFMDNNVNNNKDMAIFQSGKKHAADSSSNSGKLKERRKHRDAHNLRLLTSLHAANPLIGIPALERYCPEAVSKPIAFHDARVLYKRQGHLKGSFVHFYVDDYQFECIRRSPERYLDMLKSADFIVAPDFSTYRNFPFPVLLKNVFDNMLLAAYYQKEGVNVVANVIWASPVFYEYTFSGIPHESTVCVSSKSVDLRDKKGLQQWLHGYREAIERLNPSTVIRIGKLIPGEETIHPDPVRVETDNPYIKRLSHGR